MKGMFLTAVVLAFFYTLAIGIGIIVINWVITQLGVTLFAMLMIVLSLIFLLAMGETDYDGT